jgi:hypothetical protein
MLLAGITWAGSVHVGDIYSSFWVASTELALASTVKGFMKEASWIEGRVKVSASATRQLQIHQTIWPMLPMWISVELTSINLSLDPDLSELGDKNTENSL